MQMPLRALVLSLSVLAACPADVDPGPDDMGGSETATDDGSTASNTQDACCRCTEGELTGCEPWSMGDDCEGMVVEGCELVGNTLVCGAC